MITPAQYRHKLSELNLDALSQPLSEATNPALQELQGALHQMEQDINREMHVIRTEYQTRINSANRGGTSRVLVSGKQASGNRKMDEVAKLEADRDQRISPLMEVKSEIEDLLQRVEAALTGAKHESTGK